MSGRVIHAAHSAASDLASAVPARALIPIVIVLLLAVWAFGAIWENWETRNNRDCHRGHG